MLFIQSNLSEGGIVYPQNLYPEDMNHQIFGLPAISSADYYGQPLCGGRHHESGPAARTGNSLWLILWPRVTLLRILVG